MKRSLRHILENTVLTVISTCGIITLWQQLEKAWYGEVQPRAVDSVVMCFWLIFGALSYIKGRCDEKEDQN